MNFPISRREVLNNLIRFKEAVSRMERDPERNKDEEEKKDPEKKRRYKALLNRKTGDIRFAQSISLIESKISSNQEKKELAGDWEEITLEVHSSRSSPTHFEITDGFNKPLSSQKLEPIACRIAKETIDVLNQKALHEKVEKGRLAEEALLSDLSSIQLASLQDWIEDMAGWMGAINRLEAEALLEKEPVGTYLLREGDEETIGSSFHFAQENHLWIHPYLITVVEEEGKISDILVLHTDRGWIKYQDDPNLNDKDLYSPVPNVSDLLSQMGSFLKKPFRKHG